MKKNVTILLLLLMGVYGVSFGQIGTVSSRVKRHINNKESSAALKAIQTALEYNYPSDEPQKAVEYAALLQDVMIGLGQESTSATFSMNVGLLFAIQSYYSEAELLQIKLLSTAASKGHEGAMQMLQLKAAMYGGGNINYNNNSGSMNSGSSGSSVGQKTCSYCNGKGWVAGSKTTTYGNMGTYWCNDCHRDVPQSHSHDHCPSCNGRGVR